MVRGLWKGFENEYGKLVDGLKGTNRLTIREDKEDRQRTEKIIEETWTGNQKF